jgi:hypothetical protein
MLCYSQELSNVISKMLRRSSDRRPNTDDILNILASFHKINLQNKVKCAVTNKLSMSPCIVKRASIEGKALRQRQSSEEKTIVS